MTLKSNNDDTYYCLSIIVERLISSQTDPIVNGRAICIFYDYILWPVVYLLRYTTGHNIIIDDF